MISSNKCYSGVLSYDNPWTALAAEDRSWMETQPKNTLFLRSCLRSRTPLNVNYPKFCSTDSPAISWSRVCWRRTRVVMKGSVFFPTSPTFSEKQQKNPSKGEYESRFSQSGEGIELTVLRSIVSQPFSRKKRQTRAKKTYKYSSYNHMVCTASNYGLWRF